MTSRHEYDAVIIGGGPAGAAASRLLSLWGHQVCVLTRPQPDRRPLAESIPPSCDKLLELVGVTGAVQKAGFQVSRGNTVWWGAAPRHVMDFADGSTGLQVLRSELDSILLRASVEAGATVRADATVRAVDLERPDPQVSFTDASGEPGSVTGRVILDCSGRSGVIGGAHRSYDRANATIALCGRWKSGDWGLADDTHTLVESYRDGWAWSIPTEPGVRFVTVMVDPRRTELSREPDREAVYLAELAKTVQFRALIGRATRDGDVWGHNASQYSADRYHGSGFLLVGDAGSFIDPLSSFGVKKALASGWLAAVVVNTEREHPNRSTVARELYDRREKYVWSTYRTLAAQFYRDAAKAHGQPFWEARDAAAPPALGDGSPVAFEQSSDPLDTGGEPDVSALRDDPGVLSAFDALRRAPSIRLRPGRGLVRIQGPAVDGRLVILEERLATPELTEGLRFLRGIDLPHLVRLAPEYDQVPDLFDAYCRSQRPVILPDFLGAISVLLAREILVNEAID